MPVARFGAATAIAVQGLRARPLRSVLVVLTLALGVLAVISVFASSTVAERAIRARAELTTGRAPTYTATLSPAASAALLGRPRTPGLALTAEAPVQLGQGASRISVTLVAVAGDLRGVRPLPVRAGAWLDAPYASGFAAHLVLNAKAADAVAAADVTPIVAGRPPSAAIPVQVVGVVEDAGEAATAYVRWDEAAAWLGGLGPTRAWVHGDARALAALSATTLGAPRAERSDQGEALSSSVGALQWIFTVIAVVALVVAAVAVLNIGLATVNERVDELALRRALGATRGLIVAIVLSEALLLGVLAAVVALALAVPLLNPLSALLFPDLPPGDAVAFPLSGATIAVASGLAASGLGGLAPALKAASIPIAHVMRA